MGFALPLALLALAGLAIPVVAHLIRRRDLPRIVLPSLVLLEEAIAESRHKRSVEDPWLLALRLALLAAAALAFSAPFVNVSVADGDGRTAALAVVIDASTSTEARSSGGTVFEVSRARALRAIRALPRGSEITVVIASTPPRVVVDRLEDSERAVAALEHVRAPEHGGDDLGRAFEIAARRLASATLAERRLLVFSDFATHVDTRALRVPPGVRAEVVRVETTSSKNAGVTVRGVEAAPDGPRRLIVRCEVVSNLGRTIELRIVGEDGTLLATTQVPPSRDPREIAVPVDVPREGAGSASVKLEVDDALEADDSVDFVLRAPDEVRVLFVDGDPHPSRRDDEVGFAARALELAPPSEGRFRSAVVDPDRLDSSDLGGVDVVVLANVSSVTPHAARMLERFVFAGGGLWLAGGDHVRGTSLDPTLQAVLPARVGARVADPAMLGVVVERTSGSFSARGLSSTRVVAHHALEAKLGALVAAKLDDGTPWIVSGTHGSGRVLVLGSSLDDADSDFPLRAGFLPATIRFVRELAPRRESDDEAPLAPLSESRLEPGPLPNASGSTGTTRGTTRLRRDVSTWVFVALGLLVAAEGFARFARAKRASPTPA